MWIFSKNVSGSLKNQHIRQPKDKIEKIKIIIVMPGHGFDNIFALEKIEMP